MREPPVLPSISCLAPCAPTSLQLCVLWGPEQERRLGFRNSIHLSFCELFCNFLGACLGAEESSGSFGFNGSTLPGETSWLAAEVDVLGLFLWEHEVIKYTSGKALA